MADISSYGDNPWAGVTDKTHEVFIPELLSAFRQGVLFQQFVPFKVDLRAQNAETMTFTAMHELEQNINSIGLRDMWLDTNYTDSETKSITLEHHGDKVTLHKYDEYITQWRKQGLNGLRAINKDLLGASMVRYLERLARNAFLSGTYHLTGGASLAEGHDFSTLASNGTDNFDPSVASDIWLGMQTRGMHGAMDYSGNPGSLVAITSPGVIRSIQDNSGWISAMERGDPSRLLRYEVGMYKNVRYISTPDMILWNAGALEGQWAISSALHPNGGADRNVDANRVVGQSSLPSGAQRYIQLDSTNIATSLEDDIEDILSPGDVISIHTVRTSDYGITNGLDWKDGMTIQRRVVSVDDSTKRITVDKPVLLDYRTDLGSGVYGYVTKGETVHATAFMTGPNAVVAGIAQPPETHTPRPFDDLEAFYRFSWDMYGKYQIWNDHNVEVCFNTGPYRIKGLAR